MLQPKSATDNTGRFIIDMTQAMSLSLIHIYGKIFCGKWDASKSEKNES